VIAWVVGAGLDLDINCQCFDAAANPVSAVFQVNQESLDIQSQPDVAIDEQGNFVVTWTSWIQDGDGFGVFARHYDASCTASGDELQVNQTVAGDQTSPVVAMDNRGNIAVAWQSQDQDGDGLGIYLRTFNRYGQPTGDEVLVNQTTAGDQDSPSIAFSEGSGIVVVWRAYNVAGGASGSDVMARLFHNGIFSDGFESGDTSAWSVAVTGQ
jgi:hypothetical protein